VSILYHVFRDLQPPEKGRLSAPVTRSRRRGITHAAGARRSLQVVQRVDERAVQLDTEVAVVAAGNAGGAHPGDKLSLVDLLALGRHKAAVVPVVRLVPVAVVDDNKVSVAAHPAGVRHRAAVGGVDGRAVPVGDVDALVVVAGTAQIQIAIPEPAGDAAVARPAEAAGGIPCGTLLGAPQLVLRHRLGQRHAGDHLALRLLAVDVRHVGGHVRLAVHAGGRDLILALIHGRIVGVLHLIGHILHVPLPLHVHHRQIGHGVADGQHVAHPEDLGVVAYVQLHQVIHAHVVLRCDAVIAVTGGDGVRHLALLRLVEDLGDIAQIHHVGRLHVLLPDVHLLHEVGVHRVRCLVAQLQLLQKILQRAGTGGGDHLFSVHVQHVGVFHLAQRVAQRLLELLPVEKLPPGEHACGHGQLRCVHGVVLVAGGLAGDRLQRVHRLRHRPPGGGDAQHLPVVGDLRSQRVQGQHRGSRRDGHGTAEERHRVELQPLKEMAAFAALPRPALPPGGKALPPGGGGAGHGRAFGKVRSPGGNAAVPHAGHRFACHAHIHGHHITVGRAGYLGLWRTWKSTESFSNNGFKNSTTQIYMPKSEISSYNGCFCVFAKYSTEDDLEVINDMIALFADDEHYTEYTCYFEADRDGRLKKDENGEPVWRMVTTEEFEEVTNAYASADDPDNKTSPKIDTQYDEYTVKIVDSAKLEIKSIKVK